mmetsp:Transcript_681/g.1566  ORF Transcript_681/g.1566 Transcript_681/m.1566 type:complete len:103 (-) Transcript_681:86-394(-)
MSRQGCTAASVPLEKGVREMVADVHTVHDNSAVLIRASIAGPARWPTSAVGKRPKSRLLQTLTTNSSADRNALTTLGLAASLVHDSVSGTWVLPRCLVLHII